MKQLGIDHDGYWTPAQYIIDAGWPKESVEMTALNGVSDEDVESLTTDQVNRLLDHCRNRALESMSGYNSKMRLELDTLKRQRDELVEALTRIANRERTNGWRDETEMCKLIASEAIKSVEAK